MQILRYLHRIATIVIVVFVLYLGVTGTIIQAVDLRSILSDAPATDANVMAMREAFDGPGDFMVRKATDYDAPALPATLDYATALPRLVAAARRAVGDKPLGYFEFRMAGGRPVAQVGVDRGYVRFDAASGQVVERVAEEPRENRSPASTRNTFKRLHRMTTFGDWALTINLIVSIGLAVLIVTGTLIYWKLWQGRRTIRRPAFFWKGGGTWRWLHRVTSIVAAAFLVVVTLSGAWLAVESAGLAINMRMSGGGGGAGGPGMRRGPPPPKPAMLLPMSFDAQLPSMLATTLRAAAGEGPGDPIRVLRLGRYTGYPQGVVVTGGGNSRQLVFNAQSGKTMSLTEPGAVPLRLAGASDCEKHSPGRLVWDDRAMDGSSCGAGALLFGGVGHGAFLPDVGEAPPKRSQRAGVEVRRGLALALAIGAAAVPVGAAEARLSAGAAKAAIDVPADLLPLQGFGTVHDPLQARVIVFDDGMAKAAIAVVDLTSINSDGIARMKEIVAAATGADPDNVLINASHTFSAPHMPMPTQGGEAGQGVEQERGARFVAAVYGAVRRAAQQAATGIRPVTVAVGAGTSAVNVNRNMLTTEGWWLGTDDAGSTDRSVGVVRFDASDGKPVAVLVNYAVQSSVMDQARESGGTKGITADLGGAAVDYVEERSAVGTVAFFLPGAAGDQAPAYKAVRSVLDKNGKAHPIDIGADGYPLVRLQGERLGAEAVRAGAHAVAAVGTGHVRVVNASIALAGQERPRNLQQIRPVRDYAYVVTAKTAAPYTIVQIGDVAIVGVQVELSAATGQLIKRLSPFRNTMVVTMVNGAAKYLPDAEAYRRFTYEAQNSSYGPGSAEILAADIVRALRAMKKR